MNSPIFSAIVPTYHRNDLLAKCLERLAPGRQTLPIEQYEVIVTDDGLNTDASELIQSQYAWAKWVAGSHRGPAANRNNGSKYARGKWLVFIDDDCLPDPQWLEAYEQAIIAEPFCLVFEGRTYVDRPRKTLAEISPINESGGALWSCNFAIERQLFESLNGFDERFPYAAMEDVDLKQRLTKTGHKSSFIKPASVCHPWRMRGGWKKLKQHQESTLIYLSLHPEESAQINYRYYVRDCLLMLLKVTLPGIVSYRFKGASAALLEHFASLQMAFILFYQSQFQQN